jgi:hypothetical protein
VKKFKRFSIGAMAAKTSPATVFLEAVGTNSRLTTRRVPTEFIYFQEHGTRAPLIDRDDDMERLMDSEKGEQEIPGGLRS